MEDESINKYNSWCKWHPLKTVMLGRSYYPEYYRDIKNAKIKDCLVRIAEETEEDFLNYKKVLEDFGCDVIRPDLNISDSIMDDMDNGKIQTLQRPPAQVRDAQLVIGNELVYTSRDHPAIREKLQEYNNSDVNDCYEKFKFIRRDSYHSKMTNEWPSYDDYMADNFGTIDDSALKEINEFIRDINRRYNFSGPHMTCVGNRIYLDTKEVHKEVWDTLIADYPDHEFVQVKIGGHNDACFHTLKEGAILSLHRYEDYSETFPGWDVCYLPNQSWDLVKPFRDLKRQNSGKWWLPGEEKNDDFTNFVEAWLQEWVGYCEETVFDVNVLMLDDKHVCVNNYNKTVFDYLKKHNIEPIISPFRHRFFWDGGLHCITLDLFREGSMENYFK